METIRNNCGHQFCGQQGGGTSTHVAPWCVRHLDWYGLLSLVPIFIIAVFCVHS